MTSVLGTTNSRAAIIFLHRSPWMVVFLEDTDIVESKLPEALGAQPLLQCAWEAGHKIKSNYLMGLRPRRDQWLTSSCLVSFWSESVYPRLIPPFGSSMSGVQGWQRGIVLEWIMPCVSFISDLHELFVWFFFFLPLCHSANKLRPLVSPEYEMDTNLNAREWDRILQLNRSFSVHLLNTQFPVSGPRAGATTN